jgi:hypothetical protein
VVLMLFYQTIHLLNGRYLLPALSAVCVLLVGGWTGFGMRIGRGILVGVVVVVLIAGIAIPPYIAGFYRRPAAVASYLIRPHRNFQAGIRLVGYEVTAVDRVALVNLYWSAAQPIMEDYFVRLEVIGEDGKGYGLFDSISGRGNHPTTNWIPDEVFRDAYQVPLRSDAPLGKGYIRVTLIGIQNPQDRLSFDLVDAPFEFWKSR